MDKVKFKKGILFSVLCFALFSFSFLLIPLSSFNASWIQLIFAYMVGGLFWLGLITGLLITFRLGRLRNDESFKTYHLPGVLCFFRNDISKKCDTIMIISIIMLIFFSETAWKLSLDFYNFFINYAFLDFSSFNTEW